jgi:hypothetical protein
LGKIKNLRRFIPNFVEIKKNIIVMLKKDTEIKWIYESRDSFEWINKSIGEYPFLVRIDYDKPFLILYFSYENTIIVVFL